jgi:hypothetical protein
MRLFPCFSLAVLVLLLGASPSFATRGQSMPDSVHHAVVRGDTLVPLTARELERVWSAAILDIQVQGLLHAALLRGFERSKNPDRLWGADYGPHEPAADVPTAPPKRGPGHEDLSTRWIVCDLDPNAAGERCSIVLWKRGAEQRATLLIARHGARPEEAQEWTVDRKGELLKALPLGRCLLDGLAMLCAPLCPGTFPACLRASGSRDDAYGRDTGAPAPALLLHCLSETCLGCVTLSIVRCAKSLGGER